MAYTRRLRWLFCVLSISILWPVTGWSVQIDPYQYRTVTGRILLEYERNDRTEDGFKDNTGRFRQTYSLDFRGNILSRNLMIYDAGVAYSKENTRAQDTSTKSDDINYSLKTTLLPKSRIPLTLYGNRNTSNLDPSDGNSTAITVTTYGMNWTGNFLTLPQMFVSAVRSEQDSDGVNSLDTDFRMNMSKELGPTSNNLLYTFTKSNVSGEDDLNTTTIDFFNNINISRYTTTSLNATRSTQNQTGGGRFDSYGVNAALSSSPSTSFNQHYGYSYAKVNIEDTKIEATSYSSDVNYRISEKTHTAFSLTVTDENSVSATETTDSTVITSNGTLQRDLTKRLYLAWGGTFNQSKSSTSSSSENNLSDLTSINLDTTVGYRRRMRRFNLSGSYKLGYTQEDDSVEGLGRGIVQTISLVLGNINFNRYFSLSLSGSDSRSKNLQGNFFSRTLRYHASTSNKTWRKYIAFNGSFNHTSKDSYLDALSEDDDKLVFSAKSKYFQNTGVEADYSYERTFNEEVGANKSSSVSFMASHNRGFYGGGLQLSVSFHFDTTRSEETTFDSRSTRYRLQYSRPLLKRVLWRLKVTRTNTQYTDTFSNMTIIGNSLFYKLRAWSISLDDEYSQENASDRNVNENRIFIRAARTFMRMF